MTKSWASRQSLKIICAPQVVHKRGVTRTNRSEPCSHGADFCSSARDMPAVQGLASASASRFKSPLGHSQRPQILGPLAISVLDVALSARSGVALLRDARQPTIDTARSTERRREDCEHCTSAVASSAVGQAVSGRARGCQGHHQPRDYRRSPTRGHLRHRRGARRIPRLRPRTTSRAARLNPCDCRP